MDPYYVILDPAAVKQIYDDRTGGERFVAMMRLRKCSCTEHENCDRCQFLEDNAYIMGSYSYCKDLLADWPYDEDTYNLVLCNAPEFAGALISVCRCCGELWSAEEHADCAPVTDTDAAADASAEPECSEVH